MRAARGAVVAAREAETLSVEEAARLRLALAAMREDKARGTSATDAAAAEATRAAEAASKAAEVAKANAFAADEDAKAKVAAEEAANAEKAAAAAKAEAEAIKAEAVKAEASNFANTPQNASDVAPGAESASTELQPDTTPTPDPPWSGRHTAILLIAITLSLFIGYALAYIYRRLADGKKARMMDEARMDDEAARPPSSPRMEAAESPPSRA